MKEIKKDIISKWYAELSNMPSKNTKINHERKQQIK